MMYHGTMARPTATVTPIADPDASGRCGTKGGLLAANVSSLPDGDCLLALLDGLDQAFNALWEDCSQNQLLPSVAKILARNRAVATTSDLQSQHFGASSN